MSDKKDAINAEFEDVTNKNKNMIKNKFSFGNIVATICLVLILLVGFVFAVSYFGGDSKKEEATAEKQEDPQMVEIIAKMDEMQKAQKASEERAKNSEEALAKAEEVIKTNNLAIVEALKQKNEAAEKLQQEINRKVSTISAVPPITENIEKLSADKTAELLFLGKPGQGFKEPGHAGGPLVFSLKQADIPGFGPVYLPNVNERRSVSGSAGEIIPAPQMRCPLPTGVTALNWVQTPIADPAKPGNFLFALTPN